MALEVRNNELSSYETSRAERLGKGGIQPGFVGLEN